MGLVDHAKALRTAATDRLHAQRVVFHHAPKCGGTSVGRALRKRYLLSQATVIPESSFRALEAFRGGGERERLLVEVLDLREQMLLYHLFEDVRCVSAHVRFSAAAHARFAERYRFVTILREPLERFWSHYRWSHGKPHAHARIEEPFEAFLETESARRLGATYAEYFSGLPSDADFRSQEAIDAAVANLGRFDAVGRLDDLPAFEESLRAALGVRVRVGHENRGRPGAGRSTVERPDLRDRVAALCAPDLAIWHRVTVRGAGGAARRAVGGVRADAAAG